MCEAELDDDRLLAIEVEAALMGLRIAAGIEGEAELRSAVEDLRHASRLLNAPLLISAGIDTRPRDRDRGPGDAGPVLRRQG